MKVDTEVRPTRYYVHFNDTSYRHDRWVTRTDISRVYRSQLRPLRTVPELPTPAPAPTPAPSSAQPAETAAADTADQGSGVGELPQDEQVRLTPCRATDVDVCCNVEPLWSRYDPPASSPTLDTPDPSHFCSRDFIFFISFI